MPVVSLCVSISCSEYSYCWSHPYFIHSPVSLISFVRAIRFFLFPLHSSFTFRRTNTHIHTLTYSDMSTSTLAYASQCDIPCAKLFLSYCTSYFFISCYSFYILLFRRFYSHLLILTIHFFFSLYVHLFRSLSFARSLLIHTAKLV